MKFVTGVNNIICLYFSIQIITYYRLYLSKGLALLVITPFFTPPLPTVSIKQPVSH